MESFGINSNYLLLQLLCFGGPILALLVAVGLLIRRRNHTE